MKVLFYNPIEQPEQVHVVSKILGVDKTFDVSTGNCGLRAFMDDLFQMSELDCFDQIEVYLTPHNQAYLRPTKSSLEKEAVSGWISFKSVKNGGGYLGDKLNIIIK